MDMISTISTENPSQADNTVDFDPDNCSYSKPGFLACYAGQALHLYILPAILAAGFFGNTFSFAVMMNSVNRKVTCCLCFAALAVSDNVALLSITMYKIEESSNFTIKESSKTYLVNLCDVYGYLLNFASGCSSILITLITYQRFTAVCKIMAQQLRITRKKAGWMILFIVIFSAVIHIPSIFTSNVISSTVCAGYSSFANITKFWVGMNIIIFFVIPVSFVTYWNFRIYLEVRRRPVDQCSNSYQLTESSTNSRDVAYISITNTKPVHRDTDRKLTRMMIFISLAFVCLSLPQHIRYIYQLSVKDEDSTKKATTFFLYHISNKLFIANHAINFYLYCLSGAKFRNDFVHLAKMPFRIIRQKYNEGCNEGCAVL